MNGLDIAELGKVAPISASSTSPAEDDVWLLNLDMVESNTGIVLDYQYVPVDSIGTSTCRFDTGNVLYSKLRPYLNKVVLPDRDGYATSEMLPLRPDPSRLTREYLTYYLRSPQFVGYISAKVSGAKMPRANTDALRHAKIPLPSLNEQRLIVSELDLICHATDVKKEQLTQLSSLVKARFIEMFGDPIANTKRWEIIPLVKAAEKIGSGATPKGGNSSYVSDGISLIRSMNVYNGYFSYNELAHITEDQAGQLDGVTVKENDVLLNITGASVARCCIVPSDVIPARVNQHVCIIRCRQDMLVTEFLSHLFIGEQYQRLLWSMAETGGATRQALTKQQIDSLRIILPPIKLQDQFASFVSLYDKSKIALSYALHKFTLLYEERMHHYFGDFDI